MWFTQLFHLNMLSLFISQEIGVCPYKGRAMSVQVKFAHCCHSLPQPLHVRQNWVGLLTSCVLGCDKVNKMKSTNLHKEPSGVLFSCVIFTIYLIFHPSLKPSNTCILSWMTNLNHWPYWEQLTEKVVLNKWCDRI